MRRAKIVCTLGPASSSNEVLEKMIEAGMNVARLNFSHGTYEQHRELYERIRTLSAKLGKPVSILQDLQGPKIRVGTFEDGAIELVEGAEFIITSEECEGTVERVSTTYEGLPQDVQKGDVLLLDDGLLRLRVSDVQGNDVHTLVEVGGTLKNNKGINLPTAAVSAPSLTPKDIEDARFGMELGVDFVALSFVRSALDIHQLRALFPDDQYPTKVIAKIEKPQAVENLEDIISVADGIMIARGDLGVELPPQKVPVIQKRAIALANKEGRISITATQMLESMTENPRPTRAEASDVANAILDGTDAVMLSGETAAGRYPVAAVRMMASIIEEVETSPIYRTMRTPGFISHLRTFPNAVAKSAAVAADELDVHGIVLLTLSGATARLMMTYRPSKQIIACTPFPKVYQQMGLYWGVRPLLVEKWVERGLFREKQPGEKIKYATEAVVEAIQELLVERGEVKEGDEIIMVMGSPIEEQSETNLMKFHRIGK